MHEEIQWFHGSQTVGPEQQTCANQTHSSVFPFSFSQPLFSFFAFSKLGGLLYQLWDTPTREKSQQIKEHWERQVEQRMRTGTSDEDLTEIRADRDQFPTCVSYDIHPRSFNTAVISKRRKITWLLYHRGCNWPLTHYGMHIKSCTCNSFRAGAGTTGSYRLLAVTLGQVKQFRTTDITI